ncbi:hypothetical protein BKA56DRAFT_504827 [Ilyonectria sp. MPI-CAGE-AT-0026]|nr:hypothetical protein BKA56DRAFT_504827 [Ilyonectria sp. MPI-CAGE-AT-0026]
MLTFTELAPSPGRCHSCDRIDRPEWRRGPDGAKTLCNACGLQYAKLERKRQLEVRLIRPKSEGLRTCSPQPRFIQQRHEVGMAPSTVDKEPDGIVSVRSVSGAA